MERKIDRYVLLCTAAVFTILMSMVFTDSSSHEAKDEESLGIAYDVRESPKGFVFQFQDSEGNSIKCFYSKEIKEGTYYLKGRMSEDGSILFVSSVKSVKVGRTT